MIFYTLKVVDIIQETADTVTLCFKQPGLKKVKYFAGQYLTLIFRINGRRYIRPYSFSSCPQVDELLEITVKRVENGIVSNHINDMIKVGDSIEVMPSMGDFVYRSTEKIKKVYLWGVGSGITPLISIAKQILSTDPKVHIHLVYGNKAYETVIFLNKIEILRHKYNSRLTVSHFFTRLIVERGNPNIIQGRIDKTKVISIIETDVIPNECAHYICGPIGLKESVKEALKEFDVDDDNVFCEDFEIIKDPKDFDGINTQIVDLFFETQKIQLEVTKGKSILEAGLDANIELPYSCQTGSCSMCKGKITRGEVKMIGLSKERDDLKQDEYLLCCTYPLSDNIYIEI